MVHRSAEPPPERRQTERWLRTAATFGLSVWVSCQVYEPGILSGPGAGHGVAGAASGGDGGDSGAGTGTGGTGLDGSGGTTPDPEAGAPAVGSGGSSSGGSDGGNGAAGKTSAAGASAGGKSGSAGAGGAAGKASASTGGAGNAGMSGSSSAGMGEGGAPDCATLGDCCPDDDTKTDPGECGCGTPDVDTDSDGTADCDDLCPMDDSRTAPGSCGCGVAGADADCSALKSSLVHRYSFSGTGVTVTDSVGTLHGTALGTGAALSGSGTLVLAGGVAPNNDPNKQYVELPTGCLADLTDATFEAWLTWSTTCGTGCTNSPIWQRVFDFGETATGTTGSYVFLTTRAGTDGPLRAAATATGGNNEASTGFQVSATGTLSAASHHFAVVVDDAASEVRLYLDGSELATAASAAQLSSIVATTCWLGRSHFAADPYLNGTFDEFRIYDAALPESAVALSFAVGPDPSFL